MRSTDCPGVTAWGNPGLTSGGDRIRTCDLEVMSLASYRPFSGITPLNGTGRITRRMRSRKPRRESTGLGEGSGRLSVPCAGSRK